MKRVLIALGVLVLLLAAFLGWRVTHPPLTDEQQILAHLNGIAAAANARSASRIGSFLSPKFQVEGVKKGDFQRQLVGGILQYRVIELSTRDVKVAVQGEGARSTGRYRLSLKSEVTSPPEVFGGDFSLRWRKEEGHWRVVGIEGKVPSLMR